MAAAASACWQDCAVAAGPATVDSVSFWLDGHLGGGHFLLSDELITLSTFQLVFALF